MFAGLAATLAAIGLYGVLSSLVRQRVPEIGVRMAFGAQPSTIFRMVVGQGLRLSAVGVGIGLVGAFLLTRAMTKLLVNVGATDPVTFATMIMVFLAIAAVACWLPGGRGSTGGGGALLRKSVVMAEVALSFVLLVGCGLMIRSAIALQHVDPGFDAKGILTLRIGNMRTRSDTERVAKVAAIRERLSAVPGVRAVTLASVFPLELRPSNGRWGTDAALGDPTKFHQGQFHVVMPGYFEALRSRVIAGRTFNTTDDVPQAKTIVIDDRVAAMAFPNASAVGKHLLARISTPEAETFEIIGVVAHQRHTTLVGDEKESIYFANGAQGSFSAGWMVRTDGDAAALGPAVRAALTQLDPQLLITNVQPLSDFINRAMASTRFALALIAVFAGLAATLAAIGLYGVLSSLVRQRVPEIGVRMAFGARPSTIFRLVIGQGLRLSVGGVTIGLVGALLLTRTMTKLLVNVGATDPLTFATMIMAFLAIAAVACWLPARRAASVEPNVALREG